MSDGLDSFLAASPQPQRSGLRLLIMLARRPRGAKLLKRLPLAEEAAGATLALDRYDEPAIATRLGWDAEAVVDRGRRLRRVEGRP